MEIDKRQHQLAQPTTSYYQYMNIDQYQAPRAETNIEHHRPNNTNPVVQTLRMPKTDPAANYGAPSERMMNPPMTVGGGMNMNGSDSLLSLRAACAGHPYGERLDRRKSHSSFASNASFSSIGSSNGGGGGGKLRSAFSGSRKKLSHCLTVPALNRQNSLKMMRKRNSSRELLGATNNRSRNQLNQGSFALLRKGAQSTPAIQGALRCTPSSSSSQRISRYYEEEQSSSNKNEEWGVIPSAPPLALPRAAHQSLFDVNKIAQQSPLAIFDLHKNKIAQQQQQHQQQKPQQQPPQQHQQPPQQSMSVATNKNILNELINGSSLTVHRKIPDPEGPLSLSSSSSRTSSPGEELFVKSDKSSNPTTTVNNADDNNLSKNVESDNKKLKLSELDNNKKLDKLEKKEETMASPDITKPESDSVTSPLVKSYSWIGSFLPKALKAKSFPLPSIVSSPQVAPQDTTPPPSQTSAAPTITITTTTEATEEEEEDPSRKVCFSIMDDVISFEVTAEDIKNSWYSLNIPRTIHNIETISRHRGIAVSYSPRAAKIPGKTCMVHIEPRPLIGEVVAARDRHREAVFKEQERQRMMMNGDGSGDVVAAAGLLDVEQLGKVAATYSRWGVELASSSWWLER